MKENPQVLELNQMRSELDFIAIDFETATHSPNSACSLGIAAVKACSVVGSAHMLIRPPGNLYHSFNIQIHGITEADTRYAPTFWQLWPQIAPLFSEIPVLAHNARFDMSVLLGSIGEQAHRRVANFPYYDTLQMVKGLVPGRRGLAACSDHFGICLTNHHNAEADAIACAEIAIACLHARQAPTLEEFRRRSPGTKCYWFHDLKPAPLRPVSPELPQHKGYGAPVNLRDVIPASTDFDPKHPLYRKSIVFTGELNIDRRAAMQLAVDVGAVIRSTISKTTDFLVAGRQNLSLVGADGRSSKERKALSMQEAGASSIRLINEAEFLALVRNEDQNTPRTDNEEIEEP